MWKLDHHLWTRIPQNTTQNHAKASIDQACELFQLAIFHSANPPVTFALCTVSLSATFWTAPNCIQTCWRHTNDTSNTLKDHPTLDLCWNEQFWSASDGPIMSSRFQSMVLRMAIQLENGKRNARNFFNSFSLVWDLMYQHAMSAFFTSDLKFWIGVNEY